MKGSQEKQRMSILINFKFKIFSHAFTCVMYVYYELKFSKFYIYFVTCKNKK